MKQVPERTRLIELVQRIRSASGTEEELNELIRELQAATGNPSISDLIYWHEPPLTDEEVVDQAMSRTGIPLRGPSE